MIDHLNYNYKFFKYFINGSKEFDDLCFDEIKLFAAPETRSSIEKY